MSTYWELADSVKQTRIDSIVNTVSYVTFLQIFYASSVCILLSLSTILYKKYCFNTCYIFQLFKACYSVQEYTCVSKHMTFAMELKKIDQNASCMIIESVNCKKMNPMTP